VWENVCQKGFMRSTHGGLGETLHQRFFQSKKSHWIGSWPGHSIIKTFYGRNLIILLSYISVFRGRPFQFSLTFVGKARSLPWSGAPERCFTKVGAGLTRKH
jgi:hypothetical protein